MIRSVQSRKRCADFEKAKQPSAGSFQLSVFGLVWADG
jgi:hypothetical protein